MPRSRPLKLYEYVAELVDAGVAVLVAQTGMTPARAREVMLLVAQGVCFRNAKSTVYIPEAANLANLQRNATIWSEYQTDNPVAPHTKKWTPARVYEIAEKYDLSPQQVYSIIRGMHESEVAVVQDELAGLDSAA